MRILITGVHGFVGSNLVKALKAENEIYGLDIISPQKDGVKFTFGWEELDNPSTGSGIVALPEVDAIIHLAGKAAKECLHNRFYKRWLFTVSLFFLSLGLQSITHFTCVCSSLRCSSPKFIFCHQTTPYPS